MFPLPHHDTDHAVQYARAIHELRMQQPIRVMDGARALGLAFPAEFITASDWQALQSYGPKLLLSDSRAKGLGYPAPAGAPVLLNVAGCSWESLQYWLWTLALHNTEDLLPELPLPSWGIELITLSKQSWIIPAFLWVDALDAAPHAMPIDRKLLAAPPAVELWMGEPVALPLEGAEQTKIRSFRERRADHMHLALEFGQAQPEEIPLVRLHSSCVTGDLLGSLRCDCGSQLHMALDQLKQAPSGLLLYLYQEGRSIGISSKLRAYALQEAGLDTFAANHRLGFASDERDFSVAASILGALGHSKIRLLTNNPQKIAAFSDAGIQVVARVPLVSTSNTHNAHYLAAKQNIAGHWMGQNQ